MTDQEKKDCLCACHENKLGKPYEHETKCCEEMNGFVEEKPEREWEEEFDEIRNDGEHASIDDNCLNEIDVIMLKDIIRSLLEAEREKVLEIIEKRIKFRLKYCREVNGLPYCKNCGLREEDVRDIDEEN